MYVRAHRVDGEAQLQDMCVCVYVRTHTELMVIPSYRHWVIIFHPRARARAVSFKDPNSLGPCYKTLA